MSFLTRCSSILHVAGLGLLLWSAQLMANTYYVATTGNDASDGQSEGAAWQTLGYASSMAMAGDTVYIKAGLYTDDPISVKNSGTASAPIVFQGYTTTPGPTPNPNYVPGNALDYNTIPVIKGTVFLNGTPQGTGIDFDTRGGRMGYIEIRNMGVTTFFDGIANQFQDNQPGYAHHLLIENVYVVDTGDCGMNFRDADSITIRNCVVANTGMANIFLDITHNSFVESCTSYATYSAPLWIRTDYHICLQDSSNNIVRNCVARNMNDNDELLHPGHGIGIKDRSYQPPDDDYIHPHSSNNKIIDCTTYSMGENFFASHESYNNEFINCTATAHYLEGNQHYWSEGLVIRDGAHDNTFRNCRSTGSRIALVIRDEPNEGPGYYSGATRPQVCRRNAIENCVFSKTEAAIEIGWSDDTLIRNCVFDTVTSVLVQITNVWVSFTGNSCRNSIVTNVHGGYQMAWADSGVMVPFGYSNFLNNSFWSGVPNMPPGIGNMEMDPLYADAANGDYHLKSAYGRWTGSAWVHDTVTSPCIDAGDPSDDFSAEPSPSGGRINIGAYGGTAEASKSAGEIPSWGLNAGLTLTVMQDEANLILEIRGAQRGDTLTIQTSPDLINWTTAETRVVDTVVERFIDSGTSEQDRRFYRVARSAP